MNTYIWKHLPYAIYLDTNVLRAAGPKLDANWINELLSITTEYSISVCIAMLVLEEWCEFIAGILENSKQKFFSSLTILQYYGIKVPTIHPDEMNLLDKKQLALIISDKFKTFGINVIPTYHVPLTQLLNEAVSKKLPFLEGGKGLCDAVILESYIKHAKESLLEPRVLVVSKDNAVKKSRDRFIKNGVSVDFLDEQRIIEKLKSLLNDEVTELINREKRELKEYVMKYENEILDYVKNTTLELTDWMLNPPFGLEREDRINGSIESILSIRPNKVTNVIGGAPIYGEDLQKGRYPLRISVELKLDVVVREVGFGLGYYNESRVVVQPKNLDGSSPIPLERKDFDLMGQESNKTIKRELTILASLDAEKKSKGNLDDFRIEKII